MANINSSWKRLLVCGCSHGHLEDRSAIDTVLKFSDGWKPHTRIHLGDAIDTAPFRSGAAGTKDEAVSLSDDTAAGVRLLYDYRPTHFFNGNHEDRLWKNMDHFQSIRAECAKALVGEIRKVVNKLKCWHTEIYSITDPRSILTLGDTKFLHGFMYNENAIRDHAEHFGKCVIAHLHTPGEGHGRRDDHPVATCVGFLADVEKLSYAKTRRATARWNHGFVWGEYSAKECVLWLAKRNQNGSWRLPL